MEEKRKMAQNLKRRHQLLDTALKILSEKGFHGLTHRAVDKQASVPMGTTVNYFSNKKDLIVALAERIQERLDPQTNPRFTPTSATPGETMFSEYLLNLVQRLRTNRDVALSLFELRLEAARNPTVREVLHKWRYQMYTADIDFNAQQELPGDKETLLLFHFAIDGFMLDALTTPLVPDISDEWVVEQLTHRLLKETA